MSPVTLDRANAIIVGALAAGAERRLKIAVRLTPTCLRFGAPGGTLGFRCFAPGR